MLEKCKNYRSWIQIQNQIDPKIKPDRTTELHETRSTILLSNNVNRQTDKETNKSENIPFFGESNKN